MDKKSDEKNEYEDLKGKVEVKIAEMDRKLDEIKESQLRIDANVKKSFKNLKKEIIDDIKIYVQETNNSRSEQPILRENVKAASSTSQSCQVVVLGGTGKDHNRTASVEKLILGQDEIQWADLAPMAEPRSHSTSVRIGNQIVVLGGGTNSIEIMDLGQHPLRWVKSKTVLPFFLFGHQTVVYQGKLIVIGGYNVSKGGYS